MLKKIFTFKNLIVPVLLLALFAVYPQVANIFLLFFAGFVIACALNPYVNILEKRLKNRTLAAAAAVIAGCFAIFVLFIPVLVMTIRELAIFLNTLPQKVTSIVHLYNSTFIFGKRLSELFSINSLVANPTDVAGNLFNRSWSFTMGIFEVGVIGVVLMMIVYYLLEDKDYLKKKFVEFFPPEYKERAADILKNISVKVGGYVTAQVLSMTAVGVMTMIVLFFMKIDYAVVLGLITGILDIVPIIGPTIAVGLILLVGMPLSIFKVILIIAIFIGIQQFSNYVVRPFVFGKWMKLHPLMLFLALFLAEEFLGFWGVILSPAIASTACVLVDELYLKPINEETQEGKNG